MIPLIILVDGTKEAAVSADALAAEDEPLEDPTMIELVEGLVVAVDDDDCGCCWW